MSPFVHLRELSVIGLAAVVLLAAEARSERKSNYATKSHDDLLQLLIEHVSTKLHEIPSGDSKEMGSPTWALKTPYEGSERGSDAF